MPICPADVQTTEFTLGRLSRDCAKTEKAQDSYSRGATETPVALGTNPLWSFG